MFETPPKALGVLDDMWWRWVIDFGLPGPDRGEGGKYLLLPPGYDGPLPEGGYFVARSRTNRVVILGRLFMENNDPKPAVDLIKENDQNLSLRSRRRRHEHRRVPDRQGQARPDHCAAADRVPRSQRQGDQHHSAE